MLTSELIEKKRDGQELTTEEIQFLIAGYTAGDIPDYQMSAFLMAVYFQGMTHRETVDLTMAMMHSGDTLDLRKISGVKADKHSTGGVGDKTSLILCPMVAAQGVKMAKMSGRGLGHTGGTIDKLESIPGFSCALELDRFFENVDRVGFAIAGQTANLDPADKKLYALRDVTGTVASIPLIVSSIMSKKLAAGADVIVLDVKVGSGGFMKDLEHARLLAKEMVAVGKSAGKKTVAVITDMDAPLGRAVGNALEVREAIETLRGERQGRLLELCLALGENILAAAGAAPDEKAARAKLLESIDNGTALEKMREFICAQGGDPAVTERLELLPQAPVQLPVKAAVSGYIQSIDAENIGRTCLHLGGGRATKESAIDLSVGVVFEKTVGDFVREGDTLAIIHAACERKAAEAAEMLLDSCAFSETAPEAKPLVWDVIR